MSAPAPLFVLVARHQYLSPARSRGLALAKGCKFVGTVVGEQGGSFSGGWTSNKNLAVGAMNDMKNEAFELGGNYVVLENTQAGNTMSGSMYGMSSTQTDVTHMGNAYKCKAKEIGHDAE